MVGSEFYFDGDGIFGCVSSDDDAFVEASAVLVRAGLLRVPRVAADSALAVVLVPLAGEAAAVELVVVVVVRSVKAEAPGGGAGRRLDEAPVPASALPHDSQYYQAAP